MNLALTWNDLSQLPVIADALIKTYSFYFNEILDFLFYLKFIRRLRE